MEQGLKKLIDVFLLDNNTEIFLSNISITLRNKEWNSIITIFSDELNGVYFEFNFLKNKKGEISKNKNSTYRIELKEAKEILNLIIETHDINKHKNPIIAKKYINIIKEILNSNNIQANLSVKQTRKKIELREEGKRNVIYLSQDELYTLTEISKNIKEPTYLHNIIIRNIDEQNINTISFHIPQYDLNNYELLKYTPKIKNKDFLVSNFNTWLNNIKNNNNVPVTPLNDILSYVQLENNIPIKPIIEVSRKIKI